MALHYLFLLFFLLSFIAALFQFIVTGNHSIFSEMVNALFDMSEQSVKIGIYLIGIMTLWLGFMKIAEDAGLIAKFSRFVSPVFSKLFKDIPKNHPASGSMLMNISANMLGLDNAATPLGIKAMKDLQSLNEDKTSASNAMIMFLVLNTSGLTLIPISVMALRAEAGAANPADIFIPILIATSTATLAGLIAVSLYQKINLFKGPLLLFLAGLTSLISGTAYLLYQLPSSTGAAISVGVGNFLLLMVIMGFLIAGWRKKLNLYDTFIKGAKEGFQVAIDIIPYLVAILVAIGLFRSSGMMDLALSGFSILVKSIGINDAFVPAMPTALMKPLSGGGARGMMLEAMQVYGADSFVGRLSGIFQGSTETTFYTLAVYYGAVKIKNIRYTLPCALFADLIGIITAIFVAYLFFY